MNVELDLADAEAILRILDVHERRVAIHPSYIDDLRSGRKALEASIEDARARGDLELDREIEELLEPKATRVLTVEPDWSLLAPARAQAKRWVGDDPKARHDLDSIAALIRDVLDRLEISLYDPASVYVIVAGAALVVELTRRREGNSEGEHSASLTYLSLLAALEDYVGP